MQLIAKVTFAENFRSYLWIALGVLIGVLLPIVSKYVREHFTAGAINLQPYLALLAFSLMVGVLILAALRQNEPDKAIDWYVALIAGYGGEATLEKLLKPGA